MYLKRNLPESLKVSGYKEELKFVQPEARTQEGGGGRKNKRRNRGEIWFNPPHSDTDRTPIGKIFLALIDKHFGKSQDSKYFNRRTIKVSYSCMANMEAVISGHNRTVLAENLAPEQIPPNTASNQITRCNFRGEENKANSL